MIEKFNIYDLVANLIPGALFFWSLEVLFSLAGYTLPAPLKDLHMGDFKEASMLIVLCYAAGLLLQSLSVPTVEKFMKRCWGGDFLSALWLQPNNTWFSPTIKERIRTLAKERFKISLEPEPPGKDKTGKDQTVEDMQLRKNQEIFYLCFTYVFNQSPRPQVFNSQYCQFRCLTGISAAFTLAAAVLTVVSALCCVCGKCDDWWEAGSLVVFTAIYAFATWLFYKACDAYAKSFAGSVYDLFVAGVAKMPKDE